ncbi:replicative DNA helicase [Vibrio sp. SCSIO 43140]|uniref:replicative DNA helicase n=1 Tax=Vibrio sp. SCSIO 43140 TaxID=2819100 RepID=UPI002074D9CA|nr:DnaB-like helicase C-terminal domain-containing protein [Vibrio sp. SCSIO 43140]USD59088.1 replicative DNA helicase [Vibrio sp. SCSIO 43140]
MHTLNVAHYNPFSPIINLMLTNSDSLNELAYGQIDPSSIADDATRVMFETCFALHHNKQSVDLNTIKALVFKEYEEDGVNAIHQLAMEALSQPANIDALPDYVFQVLDAQHLKRLEKELVRVQQLCASKSSDEVVTEMHAIVETYDEAGFTNESGPMSFKDALEITLDNMEARHKGEVAIFQTGFQFFEDMGGFRPADYIIIAARPSHGKTTLLLNLIKNSSKGNDKPFLFFSLEMSADSIAENMLANLSGVPISSIRNGAMSGDEWSAVSDALRESEDYAFSIDDDSMSVEELARRARRFYRQNDGKISGIGIDYLQLLTSDRVGGDNRNLEISEISRVIKALGKELGVPVIALSQLSRDVEKRADKRPMNSDLRDSGSLEQDADIIAFAYRPEMYNPNDEPGVAHIIISKARKAKIGDYKVSFKGAYARVEDTLHLPYGKSYASMTAPSDNSSTPNSVSSNDNNKSGDSGSQSAIEFVN